MTNILFAIVLIIHSAIIASFDHLRLVIFFDFFFFSCFVFFFVFVKKKYIFL